MFLTLKYKLKPSSAQYARLDELLRDQRRLYNAALQERQEAWKKSGVSISKLDQNKSLTQIRQFDPTYADVPVALSRWTITRVDDAMKGFFSRVKRGQKAGFPRFRSASRWSTIGFVEWSGVRLMADRLRFGGLTGDLRLHMHRPIPEGAAIKCATLTRQGRFWFVCLVVDVPVTSVHDGSAIGLDVGIEHLVTTSDGVHIPNIRPRRSREQALRRAQRALARCKRGSRRRRQVREKLARLQAAIARQRSTYLHQVSSRLARAHALIAVEDLKLRNMTRSARGSVDEPGRNVSAKAGLNRALLDAAPGRLIDLLIYKAERAGGRVVHVDPRHTSQDCSACGDRVPKALSVRQHICACGADLHRDHNAAINILARAQHGERVIPLGDAKPEVALVCPKMAVAGPVPRSRKAMGSTPVAG